MQRCLLEFVDGRVRILALGFDTDTNFKGDILIACCIFVKHIDIFTKLCVMEKRERSVMNQYDLSRKSIDAFLGLTMQNLAERHKRVLPDLRASLSRLYCLW